jgi:hypothetical protein
MPTAVPQPNSTSASRYGAEVGPPSPGSLNPCGFKKIRPSRNFDFSSGSNLCVRGPGGLLTQQLSSDNEATLSKFGRVASLIFLLRRLLRRVLQGGLKLRANLPYPFDRALAGLPHPSLHFSA